MKKILALAVVLAFTGQAAAAEGGFKKGEAPPPPQQKDAGYKGSEDTGESTVGSLATQRDNAWVTVEGYLIKEIDPGRFIFRDDSGSIEVSVPKSAWDGKEYSANDMVRLSGYVKGKGVKRYLQAKQIKQP